MSDEYVVDGIFPAREIHLIGGPSGAGKTSLLFQLIVEPLRRGHPVFGHTARAIPMCYCACDRSEDSIQRTLTRLGIKDAIPTFSIHRTQHIKTLLAVITQARKLVPDCKLLFIDAIALLVPDGAINDYKSVGDFLTDATNLCKQYGITIIGLTHSPKVKEGERYLNPRQRLMGSVIWGGCVETVILIEPSDDGEDRVVMLLPRNDPEVTLNFTFEGGKLTETSPDGLVYEALDATFSPLLKPDRVYSRLEMLELIGQLGLKCSLASFKRWLDAQVHAGRMERGAKRGTYHLTKIQ